MSVIISPFFLFIPPSKYAQFMAALKQLLFIWAHNSINETIYFQSETVRYISEALNWIHLYPWFDTSHRDWDVEITIDSGQVSDIHFIDYMLFRNILQIVIQTNV